MVILTIPLNGNIIVLVYNQMVIYGGSMKKIMLISSAILTIIVMSIITINNMDKN